MILFTALLISPSSTVWAITNPSNDQSKVTISINYFNDTAKSYKVTVNNHQTYTISQKYSWSSNNTSRFSLQGYSIDNSSNVMIPRSSSGNFTLEIPTDSNHSIFFISQKQFNVTTIGTNLTMFSPSSPTKDEWFDKESEIRITVPYIIVLAQNNTRKQLASWSIDNSDDNVISRQEVGFFESPIIHVSRMHKINFEYKIQYYIKTISEFGRSFGTGWYDYGTITNVSVMPLDEVFINHVFTGWQGSVIGQGKQESVSVFVDTPKILVATWDIDYTNISILGVVIVIVLVTLIIYHKRKPRFQISKLKSKTHARFSNQ